MNWETLPGWFWGIYYLFLVVTLGMAIWSIKQKRLVLLSILVIILVALLLIISLFYSIGRPRGTNELEFVILELQQGAWWALFALAGYLFLLVWWLLFFMKKKKAYL